MLIQRIHFITIMFFALIVGCANDVTGQIELGKDAEQFIPPDATERIVAPDLPWLQISFNVKRPWLQFSFDETQIRDAQLTGWNLCRPVTNEWEGYEDRAVTPPSYRRQRTYLLYKDGVSMQFFGMYNTPLNSSGTRSRDEKPIQQGILIVKKETASETLQVATNFHLSCDAPAASH